MTTEIDKFNATKYGTLYIKILQKANNKNRTKLKKDDPLYVYYELHHILPKSIYPEYKNLKKFPSNSILLTAREHFICHILLMKHYKKLNNKNAYIKMSKALHRLSSDGKHNSKIYESLKLNLSHTEETKEKMRGRVVTKEQREVLRLANLGKKQSKETINKRANKLRGMKRSKKVGEEISKRQRGTNNPLYNPFTIYDNNNNPILTSLYNHRKNLKDLNLPSTLMYTSIDNRLYAICDNKKLSFLRNNGNIRYKGYYIEKIRQTNKGID